jgi:hypothetical protein
MEQRKIMTDREEAQTVELYITKIKSNCFLCGGEIPKTWQHYKVMGNCCGKCSSIIGKKAQERIKSKTI